MLNRAPVKKHQATSHLPELEPPFGTLKRTASAGELRVKGSPCSNFGLRYNSLRPPIAGRVGRNQLLSATKYALTGQVHSVCLLGARTSPEFPATPDGPSAGQGTPIGHYLDFPDSRRAEHSCVCAPANGACREWARRPGGHWRTGKSVLVRRDRDGGRMVPLWIWGLGVCQASAPAPGSEGRCCAELARKDRDGDLSSIGNVPVTCRWHLPTERAVTAGTPPR